MSESKERKPGRPSLDTDMALLNTTVERETLERVRKHVKKQRMTLAGFVRKALEQQLEREDADD